MKQRLPNIRSQKKERIGFIPLCIVLVMIVAITILAGCMNNSDPMNSDSDAADILAEEQAKVLEVILFYGVGESQHVIDTDQEAWRILLKKVSDKAAQEESFKFLQENRLDYHRAFYTDVVGEKLNDEQNKLIFTMLANLTQGITRNFSLDVYMIKENNEWTFDDFGNLYVEEYGDSKGINIEDDTFVENYSRLDPS